MIIVNIVIVDLLGIDEKHIFIILIGTINNDDLSFFQKLSFLFHFIHPKICARYLSILTLSKAQLE